MNARREPADIVDACIKWAMSSIDAWTASASAMASKVETGSYTAADVIAGAGVWAGRSLQATYDLYDAIINGPSAGKVLSDEFPVADEKLPSAGPAGLRLAGQLQATMTQTVVGYGAVDFVPEELQRGAASFRLEIDPKHLPGDAYWGKVEVTDGTTVLETVDVVVQVP